MRASIAAEKLSIPTVSFVCEGFALQGEFTAAGSDMPNLPMAIYPGHVNFHSVKELENNIKTMMVEQLVRGLTVQPQETKPQVEPGQKDIVFQGTFEEVNEFFYSMEWGDGLPVIPPTIEKVNKFLEFTDKPAEEVIGLLLPDRREATVWSIAVNGVMAGCRPEYMPVLVALIEAMAAPQFGVEHLGHTPGTEALITLNGPIIKDLGFNYEQGALRVGFQANTSIGRFWRLYLRNAAGFLPHKADKATFGGTWRVVLAENEDEVAKIGWEPMSVDQGFQAGDNVVTVSSCTSTDSIFAVGAATAEQILDKIATRVVDNQAYLFAIVNFLGPSSRPQIILSPSIARQIAKGGYSKDKMKQYLYEHAKFPAEKFEKLRPDYVSLCEAVKQGKLPGLYCQSADPGRLVPIVWSPADFMITVSGDPDKDNCFLCAQNGFIGYPVSKKIGLPTNWKELLRTNRQSN